MAECDVRLSADGVVFLLHDSMLDRTTDGSGRAEACSWNELAALDAGRGWSAGHPEQRVPSLAQVLALADALDLRLNLELKPDPGGGPRLAQHVAEALVRHAGAHPSRPPPLLSSFDASAIDAARGAAPHCPRALLFETLAPTSLDAARALGCIAVGASYRGLDAAAIGAAHAAGLAAIAYTVNEPADAERLRAAGIDALFTDALDVFDPRR